MKDKINRNSKEQLHGYLELYWGDRKDMIWVRGCFRYDLEIGYLEDHEEEKTLYNIR